MRRHGELVRREQIEEIEAALDEHGFLDSERFAERRRAVDAEFLAAPARPAAHAGGAYAGDPRELRRAMDGFFAAPAGPGAIQWTADARGAPVRGIIAPHIDFHRGGPAYAWAYRDLAERCDADCFVILGTCHAGMRDPFALTRKDYATPAGSGGPRPRPGRGGGGPGRSGLLRLGAGPSRGALDRVPGGVSPLPVRRPPRFHDRSRAGELRPRGPRARPGCRRTTRGCRASWRPSARRSPPPGAGWP